MDKLRSFKARIGGSRPLRGTDTLEAHMDEYTTLNRGEAKFESCREYMNGKIIGYLIILGIFAVTALIELIWGRKFRK